MSILAYMCLVVVLVCVGFLLLYRKIQVNTAARAWSCFTLLGIIGLLFAPKFNEVANIFFLIGLAGQHIYITVKAYKRGYI